jgi:5-methylcytosine-specific restriction endonuclease McrA
MDMCGICGENIAEDTHHIVYQKDIEDNTKNFANNLIQLCKGCHKKEHGNKLKIHGFIDTMRGKEIKYELYV